MGKSRTLSAQFYNALQSINLADRQDKRDSAYASMTGENIENTTKKDFKDAGISSCFVFSYRSMSNTLDISKQFAKYLKMEYNITKANKITPAHAHAFLDFKASQGASDRTLLAYRSALVKINTAIMSTYHCRGFCRGQDNIKNYVIHHPQSIPRRLSNEQIEQVINAYGGKYRDAMLLQCFLGMRVNEVKNININDFIIGAGSRVKTLKQGVIYTANSVYIHNGTKGGLPRYVPFGVHRDAIISIIEKYQAQGISKPFEKLERHDYNKLIKRVSDRLGFGPVGSSHEFRKYYASMLYNSLVVPSMGQRERLQVARYVVNLLGHGKARDDLIRTYIGVI